MCIDKAYTCAILKEGNKSRYNTGMRRDTIIASKSASSKPSEIHHVHAAEIHVPSPMRHRPDLASFSDYQLLSISGSYIGICSCTIFLSVQQHKATNTYRWNPDSQGPFFPRGPDSQSSKKGRARKAVRPTQEHHGAPPPAPSPRRPSRAPTAQDRNADPPPANHLLRVRDSADPLRGAGGRAPFHY